ncbi:MAG: hypothetical protein WC340_01465 [Kiritimatiellia bacterium]
MNLTLKQLFKFGAVCVSVCALSASAVDYVSDSFEAPEGSDELAIGEYKRVISGVNGEYTNLAWVAGIDDTSRLVPVNAAYADIVGEGPITNGAKLLMLKLETENDTLSRAVTNELSIETATVYIDTLIQFTPSDEAPSINTNAGTDVKIALYVNAESNLVVVSQTYEELTYYTKGMATSEIDLGYPIDPEKWYRLTMRVVYDDPDRLTDIWVDGELVIHTNGYDIANACMGGSSFVNINSGADDISFISFQGTGSLDELVVTDEEPPILSTPSIIKLTLVSVGGTVIFSPEGTADSGVEVTMTAGDWYEIISVTGPINEDLSSFLPAKAITNVLTAGADCSVTATVAKVSSGSITIGGIGYDLGTVATWALANSIAEGGLVPADMDDYLLNVGPGTDATIEIKSIVVDKDTGKTTITVGSSEPLVDFTKLNGTVYVYTTTDLAVPFALTEKSVVELTPDVDKATLEITVVSDEFIKAVVK